MMPARLLLLLTFTATTALAPQAMASCPRHAPAGSAHAAAPVEAGGHQGAGKHGDRGVREDDSAHGDHENRDEPGDHEEHGDHCCCLGQCCPGGSAAHPAPGAGPSAAARDGRCADRAHPAAARLDPDPWILPYPNAPPAGS